MITSNPKDQDIIITEISPVRTLNYLDKMPPLFWGLYGIILLTGTFSSYYMCIVGGIFFLIGVILATVKSNYYFFGWSAGCVLVAGLFFHTPQYLMHQPSINKIVAKPDGKITQNVVSRDETKKKDDSNVLDDKLKATPAEQVQDISKWKWFTNEVVVFRNDLTFTSNGKVSGTYSIENDQCVMKWNSGNVDTMTLKDNAKLLDGRNNNGSQVWGIRIFDENVKSAKTDVNNIESNSENDVRQPPNQENQEDKTKVERSPLVGTWTGWISGPIASQKYSYTVEVLSQKGDTVSGQATTQHKKDYIVMDFTGTFNGVNFVFRENKVVKKQGSLPFFTKLVSVNYSNNSLNGSYKSRLGSVTGTVQLKKK